MTHARKTRLTRQVTTLARAAPQVMGMRLGRLMDAAFAPEVRDGQEIYRMTAEKVQAFGESWWGMGWQLAQAQQQFACWWCNAWWRTALGGGLNPPSPLHLVRSAQQRLWESALDTAITGMDPVCRRVTANARRLSGRQDPPTRR